MPNVRVLSGLIGKRKTPAIYGISRGYGRSSPFRGWSLLRPFPSLLFLYGVGHEGGVSEAMPDGHLESLLFRLPFPSDVTAVARKVSTICYCLITGFVREARDSLLIPGARLLLGRLTVTCKRSLVRQTIDCHLCCLA